MKKDEIIELLKEQIKENERELEYYEEKEKEADEEH